MLSKSGQSKELCDVYEDWSDVTQVAFTPSNQMHERFILLDANCIPLLSTTSASVILHVLNTINNDVMLHRGVNCGSAESGDNNNLVYSIGVDGNKINDSN